jgi:hypothetical protein
VNKAEDKGIVVERRLYTAPMFHRIWVHRIKGMDEYRQCHNSSSHCMGEYGNNFTRLQCTDDATTPVTFIARLVHAIQPSPSPRELSQHDFSVAPHPRNIYPLLRSLALLPLTKQSPPSPLTSLLTPKLGTSISAALSAVILEAFIELCSFYRRYVQWHANHDATLRRMLHRIRRSSAPAMSMRERGAWEQLRLQLLESADEWHEIYLDSDFSPVTVTVTVQPFSKSTKALVGSTLTQHFGYGRRRREHHLAYDDFVLAAGGDGNHGGKGFEHAAVRAVLLRSMPYLLRNRLSVVVGGVKPSTKEKGAEVVCGNSTLAKFGSSSEYYDVEDYLQLVNQWATTCTQPEIEAPAAPRKATGRLICEL